MKILIGLEIHVPLNKLKSKLFCYCPIPQANTEPNTYVCEICLGHPGARPKTNRKAVEAAIKLALTLNCKISNKLIFSRKTYFYPDLPKNFQITQYEWPLAKDGWMEIRGKKIRIKRIHLEEDPGSIIHANGYVLIDYNRSGIPLCEIVTEPDLSIEQLREFLNKLKKIIEYLDLYADTKGPIKADLNISVEGNERVEIKNIGSFAEIEKAAEKEIERQLKLLNEGKTIKERETRWWNAEKGQSMAVRKKELEADYGYITEPDLGIMSISKEWIEELKKQLPLFAEERYNAYLEMGIGKKEAEAIVSQRELAELFEILLEKVGKANARWLSRWFVKELMRCLNWEDMKASEIKCRIEHLVELLQLLLEKKITEAVGKKLIERLVREDFSPKTEVEKQGLLVLQDESQIKAIIEEVMKENEKAVNDYKEGNEKAFHFLFGRVMAKTRGKADPKLVEKILKGKLEKF